MKREKDIMIVGQGIGGTMLAWHSERSGLTFDIYDIGALGSASAVSSGIINPVTGPKYIKPWMLDKLLPYALQVYSDISITIGRKAYYHLPLWRHLPTVKSENLWHSRMIDPGYGDYMDWPGDTSDLESIFPSANTFGIIKAAYRIDVPRILTQLRERWRRSDSLIEQSFKSDQLATSGDYHKYQGVRYRHVILAMGHRATSEQLFSMDAYYPVKGEVLLAKIDGLPSDRMIHFGKFFVPIRDNIYWVGSNYQHDYRDSAPDKSQAEILHQLLRDHIKLPYKVIDHLSGIRPASKVRRPLVGEHPERRGLYLFNGLGTRGMSLAPYLSHQLIAAIRAGQKYKGTQAFRKAIG